MSYHEVVAGNLTRTSTELVFWRIWSISVSPRLAALSALSPTGLQGTSLANCQMPLGGSLGGKAGLYERPHFKKEDNQQR
jgi:hypothetical protein